MKSKLLTLSAALVAIPAMALAAPVVVPHGSMIDDFEGGALGGAPAGWTTFGNNVTVQQEGTGNRPAAAFSGSQFVQMFGSFNAPRNFSGIFLDMPIRPGQLPSISGVWFVDGRDWNSGDDATTDDGAGPLDEAGLGNGDDGTLDPVFMPAMPATNINDNLFTASIEFFQADGVTQTGIGGQFFLGGGDGVTQDEWVAFNHTAGIVAPANTALVRMVVVFHNMGFDGGSVFFDDPRITIPEPSRAILGALALVPLALRRRRS